MGWFMYTETKFDLQRSSKPNAWHVVCVINERRLGYCLIVYV